MSMNVDLVQWISICNYLLKLILYIWLNNEFASSEAVFFVVVAKTINRVHNQMSYSNTVIVLLKKRKILGEWGG